MPRQHTDQWLLRQQKLSGKSKGKWRTRTSGSEAQIGQKYRKQRLGRHVIGPKLKTRSLSHKLILPTREGEGKKPREIKPRAVKIPKKPKLRTGMTHLEKMHLLSMAKQHELDPQEIDSKIGYYENKRHLEELAKEKGVSEEEIKGSEAAQEEMVSAHEEYLHHLVSELVESGYRVIGPED